MRDRERVNHIRLTRFALLELVEFGGEPIGFLESSQVVPRTRLADLNLKFPVELFYGI
jgi:hypothetical protein